MTRWWRSANPLERAAAVLLGLWALMAMLSLPFIHQ